MLMKIILYGGYVGIKYIVANTVLFIAISKFFVNAIRKNEESLLQLV